MNGPAGQLLGFARDLMAEGVAAETTLWARCSALLTRQALEAALDECWSQRAPEVAQASRHSQLLCLGVYLEDEELAARVAHTWSALSNACHYHSYELVPTAGELEGWMEVVGSLSGHCLTSPPI